MARAAPSRPGSSFNPSSSFAGQQNLQPVASLQFSGIVWMPVSVLKNGEAAETESHEGVNRKMCVLLNKQTMEHFKSLPCASS